MNVRTLIQRYLGEDSAWRDASSAVAGGIEVEAEAVAREPGVVAGLEEAAVVFDELSPSPEYSAEVGDGDRVSAGDVLFTVEGDGASVLRGERLALNVVGRMSGVATSTREVVDQTDGVTVAATRKTTPGFRYFEKRAVEVGGGDPHRYDLADSVMLKENHIAALGLEAAVTRAREEASFTSKIEVEAEDVDTAVEAADHGVDVVLLDNMSPEELEAAVEALAEYDVLVEASGGISPENVSEYASTGVDVVSMGGLTRSSEWMDVSMTVVEVND